MFRRDIADDRIACNGLVTSIVGADDDASDFAAFDDDFLNRRGSSNLTTGRIQGFFHCQGYCHTSGLGDGGHRSAVQVHFNIPGHGHVAEKVTGRGHARFGHGILAGHHDLNVVIGFLVFGQTPFFEPGLDIGLHGRRTFLHRQLPHRPQG